MMRWRRCGALLFVGGVLSAVACDCEPAEPCVCADTLFAAPGQESTTVTTVTVTDSVSPSA